MSEDEVVGELDVGRKGGTADAVVVVEVRLLDDEEVVLLRHSLFVPQMWSVGQHPPPKLAAQDLKPDVQVDDLGVVEVDVVLLVGEVVGTGTGTTVVVVRVVGDGGGGVEE